MDFIRSFYFREGESLSLFLSLVRDRLKRSALWAFDANKQRRCNVIAILSFFFKGYFWYCGGFFYWKVRGFALDDFEISERLMRGFIHACF